MRNRIRFPLRSSCCEINEVLGNMHISTMLRCPIREYETADASYPAGLIGSFPIHLGLPTILYERLASSLQVLESQLLRMVTWLLCDDYSSPIFNNTFGIILYVSVHQIAVYLRNRKEIRVRSLSLGYSVQWFARL